MDPPEFPTVHWDAVRGYKTENLILNDCNQPASASPHSTENGDFWLHCLIPFQRRKSLISTVSQSPHAVLLGSHSRLGPVFVLI